MAEHRRIPQVERLEVRDMPSVLGLPVIAPPFHDAGVAPQVAVLAPSAPTVAGASPATCEVASPVPGNDHNHPLAAVWQHSTDALLSSVGDGCDTVTTDWTQSQALDTATVTDGVTTSDPEAHATGDSLATDTVTTAPQEMPTIAGVMRYAWKSVNRHRVDDRDDAVQQICLEWLLLAATIATTYDDVRRIVGRVIHRAYRRLKKQELALELLDVPVHADPVRDAFRDIQLDQDLGMKGLTDREWQAIRLRQQGYTFTEIGEEMGMRRQRAYELCAAALSALQKRYRKSCVLD